MACDIRIKNGNDRFKFRVGGVVENKGKVLIVKMNQNNFYCFPGGHIELFEDSKLAIERELKEELSFDVKIKNLFAINENFYKLRGDNFHELCFYYYAQPTDENIPMTDKFVKEQDKEGIVTHSFKWVTKEELNTFDVKPKQIVDYVINGGNLKHFITKEV